MVEMRAQIFGGLAMSWGEEKVDEFVQKLKSQSPMLIKGGTTVIQLVGNGERLIGIGTYMSKAPFWRRKGAPVDWTTISPVPAVTYGIYVPQNPMHPNAAKLFAGFYGSPEAHQALEKACYKCPVFPESGTELAKTIQKEGLQIIIIEKLEQAQRYGKLEEKYTKMFGGLK